MERTGAGCRRLAITTQIQEDCYALDLQEYAITPPIQIYSEKHKSSNYIARFFPSPSINRSQEKDSSVEKQSRFYLVRAFS